MIFAVRHNLFTQWRQQFRAVAMGGPLRVHVNVHTGVRNYGESKRACRGSETRCEEVRNGSRRVYEATATHMNQMVQAAEFGVPRETCLQVTAWNQDFYPK